MTLTLRSEIIDQYRDRIYKSSYFRLSSDDLQVLINGFIVELQDAKTEKKIRALCESEIKLLEEGYPQPSVAKYLTKYRKAIATAIEDGSLPLTKANSHRYIHQQRVTGVQKERLEHWALTYLKYSPEVYDSIDKRSQLVNRDKQLNLRLVPVEQYLDLLHDFLEKKGRFEARWLATAIAGLTGRRFAEVVAKGTFSLTGHPHLLHFEGQLKSRAGHGEGYNIVTLFPAAVVLEAIERLRKLPEVKAIAKLKGSALSTALNAFNQKLNSVTGKVLIQVVPPLEGKKAVSVHNLRSLYGAIAVHFFCPEHQHEYAFVQHFLGHVMDSPATGHYFRYALSDDKAGLLRTKGVLLDSVPELTIGGAEREPIGELDDELLDFDLEQPIATATAAAVEVPEMLEDPEAKPKRGRRPKAQVDVAAVVAAVPEKATAEPQKVPHDLRSELERRLEQMRAEFQAQIQELRQESNVGWFVRRVEGLERENLTLRIERDKAITAVQKTDDAEVVQLRKEKEAIALELKQAQEKLDTFKRLLNGGTAEERAAESGEAFAQQQTADVVTVVEQRAAAVKAEGAAAIVPQNAWTGRTRVEAETGAKRGPKGGKAFKRAEAIFLAVKDWNRLNPFETVAFNAGILETVFKVHRQAAKDFFEAYQNELWEYHQEIGVESPKWHNRGKDMEKLRAFVEGKMAGE
jgi:integrase